MLSIISNLNQKLDLESIINKDPNTSLHKGIGRRSPLIVEEFENSSNQNSRHNSIISTRERGSGASSALRAKIINNDKDVILDLNKDKRDKVEELTSKIIKRQKMDALIRNNLKTKKNKSNDSKGKHYAISHTLGQPNVTPSPSNDDLPSRNESKNTKRKSKFDLKDTQNVVNIEDAMKFIKDKSINSSEESDANQESVTPKVSKLDPSTSEGNQNKPRKSYKPDSKTASNEGSEQKR